MKKRDGSTFVEAAVVFPVCFLAVISTICIMLFMFRQVSGAAMTHVAANAEAGRIAGTVETLEHEPRGVSTYEGRRDMKKCVYAEKGIRSRKGGLLWRTPSGTARASSYIVDEAKLIRYTDLRR